MMIPKEHMEQLIKWADELGMDRNHIIEEYRKRYNSREYQKLDEATRHLEALMEVKREVVDYINIKKLRRGKI